MSPRAATTSATSLLTALAVGLAACSSDYGIEPKQSDNPPGLDTAAPPEPYPDSGTFDYAWCGEATVPDTVPRDESCGYEPVTGELRAVVEWERRSFGNYGEYSQVVMAPLVAQLTDDDGDGDIDRHDTPDIVLVSDDEGVHSHRKGVLRVMPGDGSNAGWSAFRIDVEDAQVYPYRYSNLAIGDIDNDGAPEIVGIVQVVGGSFGGDDGGGGDSGGSDTAEPGGGGDGGGGEGGGGGDGSDVPVRPSMMDGGTGSVDSPPPVCYIGAFTVDLDLEWVAEAQIPCGGHAPALADLTADGTVEVVVGDHVIAGADGSIVWIGGEGRGAYPTHPEVGWHAVPIDLDLDGRMEVLTGRTLYDADGSVICGWPSETDDGFVAAADLDGDGLGEVVSVGGGQVRVFERDCTVLAEWPLSGGGNGGPPTISDFDVDGEPEIGVADATTYSVYDADGALLWSQPVDDESSHVTGSVVFDFDSDGRPEVVYADESRLWVFDGITGEVRLSDDNHASRTLHEFPTVADVDGDGAAEILVPNGGGHDGENSNGLYVLGAEDGDWAAGRQVWNQHAYSITNINDDLSIPAAPIPNWPTWNTFRSGDVNPQGGGASPDAVPVPELCFEECPHGRIVAMVRLGNSGAVGLRMGVPVSFYAERPDGFRTLLRTEWVDRLVDRGATSDVLRVSFAVEDLPDGRLVVVADDDGDGDGLVEECSEDNNEVVLDEAACP